MVNKGKKGDDISMGKISCINIIEKLNAKVSYLYGKGAQNERSRLGRETVLHRPWLFVLIFRTFIPVVQCHYDE